MANNKWLLLALAPLLAAASDLLSAQEVAQELAGDDECRADSASASPACALSALQLRQGVAAGDASAGATAADSSGSGGSDAAPEEAPEEAAAAPPSDDDAAAAPEDLALMSHLVLASANVSDEDEDEEATEDCLKDTGGSCRFLTCSASRNAFCKKGNCHKGYFGYNRCEYKCLCPSGYCVRDGACHKSSAAAAGGAAGGRLSSQEIADVKNHFGLSTKQINLCVKEFVSTDQGSKGYITAADLVADVKKRGKQVTQAQMQSFISQYDLNHDGKLSFFEFGYMFSKTQMR